MEWRSWELIYGTNFNDPRISSADSGWTLHACWLLYI